MYFGLDNSSQIKKAYHAHILRSNEKKYTLKEKNYTLKEGAPEGIQANRTDCLRSVRNT